MVGAILDRQRHQPLGHPQQVVELAGLPLGRAALALGVQTQGSGAVVGVVTDDAARSELAMSLDELAREGAHRMLAVALEAEVDAYITAHAALVDEHGHRLVRCNGHAPARTIATGTGQVGVVRPRVDDRRVEPATGQRQQFQSAILPRWVRRSPKIAEVLPLLYLHGLSSSDFVPALEELWARRRDCRPR